MWQSMQWHARPPMTAINGNGKEAQDLLLDVRGCRRIYSRLNVQVIGEESNQAHLPNSLSLYRTIFRTRAVIDPKQAKVYPGLESEVRIKHGFSVGLVHHNVARTPDAMWISVCKGSLSVLGCESLL